MCCVREKLMRRQKTHVVLPGVYFISVKNAALADGLPLGGRGLFFSFYIEFFFLEENLFLFRV